MTREMTEREYRAALKCNGFRIIDHWSACDTTGAINPERLIGLLFDGSGTLLRRDSIALLVKERSRLANQEAPR